MDSVFDQMMSPYEIKTSIDKHNAIHEVMQQIALAALHRADFFKHAAFYGGTCLRIFHRLPRFSEDMDFSLLAKDDTFNIENYFDAILAEFELAGRKVEIVKKNKTNFTSVESAFLKDNTDVYNLQFKTEKTVKIKIELDKNPPLNFTTEHKLLLMPYSFMTRCFTIPGLYAGKMHAFLFRQWRTRVKGRDWFDLEWYVRNGHAVDFTHLKERALQSGYEGEAEFTTEVCIELLKERIKATDIEKVKADVKPFIKNTSLLDIWSTDYFLQIAAMVKFI